MNPQYLWLTGALELLTIFVVGPLVAIAILYAEWRRKPRLSDGTPYGMVCVASGLAAVLLLLCAKWMHADIREMQYFVQLFCTLLAGLLFGVCMGCGGVVFLRAWLWHKATSLKNDDQTER